MTEIRIAEFIYIPRDVLYSDLHPTLLLTYSQILGLTAGGYPGEEMQPLTLTELAIICGCSTRVMRQRLDRLQKMGLMDWAARKDGTLAVRPLDSGG